MKKTLLSLAALIFVAGCAPRYDYAVHKPEVLYKKPDKTALKKLLNRQLGKAYVWAEEGPDAFDCSGLTYYCFGSMNMQIPRIAREQAKVGKAVSVDQLQYGDLIFFDTTPRKTGQITHVGVYIGDGKFEHAANEKKGVIVTSLNNPYYRSRIRICRRYLPDDSNASSAPFKVAENGRTVVVADTRSAVECTNCYQTPYKVTASSGDYYIQVGSFRNEPDHAFTDHIRASGYDYRIKESEGSRKLLVGPFRNARDADEALPSVRRLFNPAAFVLKV